MNGRSNLVTVVAIALVAYSACDMIHEVAGHALAARFVPGIGVISLSTVALQTTGSSRIVAAAGSIANVVGGLIAFALATRRGRFDATWYFLWLLAAIDLMNGTGYLFFSAIAGYGDWAVVIAGLKPSALWRIALGAGGLALYVTAVYAAASLMAARALNGAASSALILPAYFAGGLLLVAGAVMNPIDPKLILSSGVSSGFGAMAGLLFVPRIVERLTATATTDSDSLSFSTAWVIAGIVVTICFVGVIGPGIRL